MPWTRAKSLAEKLAHSPDLTFERLASAMEEAITYGRRQEREAIVRRLRNSYRREDFGVFDPELAHFEIYRGVLGLVADRDSG